MKTGDTFIHKHFLDANDKPLQCRITAIRSGYVYYKSLGGQRLKMREDQFRAEYN